MATTQVPVSALDGFSTRFQGTAVRPSDAPYDEIRRVHNGLIDRRPALIARCTQSADVVDALAFARAHGLEVAVRGGGHNVAGRCVVDDGIVIDLSLMKDIDVDPDGRTARAQGGLTWAEFNEATQHHGLATTGGVISSTGVAGLTLGGGIGWLMGSHGLAADNLISAEVVLADGRVVVADRDSEPDLFWAIRGGGGNFGVVTSFEYRLHPVSMVTAGIVAHPFDHARDMLRFYRERTRDLPDEVVLFAGLVHAPDGSGAKLAAMVVCDSRPPGTDDAVIDDIRGFGTPALDAVQPMPYAASNQMLDGAYPRGALNYWKASFLNALDDEVIDTMIDHFASAVSPMDAMLLEHFHGAMTRVPVEATAFPHRAVGYNCLVAAEWLDPASSERCIAWTRGAYAALQPHMAARRYMNYLDDDESPQELAAAYGPNLARLGRVKAQYDPDNVFHLNHNIPPA